MFKIILFFGLVFSLVSCKTFKGKIIIEDRKTLSLKIVQDTDFTDNDDFFDEQELTLILQSGSYSTELSFSSDTNLELNINANNEEYSLEVDLNKSFPDVEKEGEHLFLFTKKELKQDWSLEGSVDTQIHHGDLIKDRQSCSVKVETRHCDHRENRTTCRWVYHYEYGRKDVEYYKKSTNYKVRANIISNSVTLGKYVADKNENVRIYEYESCCYDYSNYCLDRGRRGRKY